MAKMKWGSDINWRELDSAEYDPDDEGIYEDYDGPMPPGNKILRGDITKAWATETQNGDKMVKVLFIAGNNEGNNKQYDGCPIWENVLFTMPQVKFKWQPWLDTIGVSLADLKNKTLVDDDEERMGHRILRIGSVKFDKPIPCRVRTQVERSGEFGDQVRVGRFLPAAVDEADEDDFDDDEVDEDDPF